MAAVHPEPVRYPPVSERLEHHRMAVITPEPQVAVAVEFAAQAGDLPQDPGQVMLRTRFGLLRERLAEAVQVRQERGRDMRGAGVQEFPRGGIHRITMPLP